MLRTMHVFYAFDTDHIRSRAPDTSPHLVQIVGQVDDFRLFRRIFQRSGPFRQAGCHHDIFRRAHAGEIQINIRSLEPVGRIGFHKAVILGNFRAQRFKPF